MQAWMQAGINKITALGYRPEDRLVLVNVAEQRLYLLEQGKVLQEYPVSTSRYGAGNKEGSYQTPLGAHQIAEKIGAGCQFGEIIQARKPTGRVATVLNEPMHGESDTITSRILWLTGCEPDVNKDGEVDSYRRYIYIHGTAEEGLIGQPASIGCIRMKNADVIELFDQVEEGMWVYIAE